MNIFLISNNKSNSRVQETQEKKLYYLFCKNMGNSSGIYQNPGKVIFNFSSGNLDDHEKSVLFKGLSFVIQPKTFEY